MITDAYSGKRVLVTGATGFKGAWLSTWLSRRGVQVTGFALPPLTSPSLFDQLGVGSHIRCVEGDVRDETALARVITETEPDVIFHLAAQSLVRRSYVAPIDTFSTNVLGTAQLLEVVRRQARPVVVVIVTTDKCYENQERDEPYAEDEALGGFDPYSASKACAELVAQSYRRSFFPVQTLERHGIALATARAGNVIGAGDWSTDRIVPDSIGALAAGRPIAVRNPLSVRPWQHVLESLSGYLALGAHLFGPRRAEACAAFNFGPRLHDTCTVAEMVQLMIETWGGGSWEDCSNAAAPHEATLLRLDSGKAEAVLGWTPVWRVGDAVRQTVSGYRRLAASTSSDQRWDALGSQIDDYEHRASRVTT